MQPEETAPPPLQPTKADGILDSSPPLPPKLPSLVIKPAIDSEGMVASVNGALKRRLPVSEKKQEVKRNRLFSALVGTLQKFKKEEDRARTTAAAQRRAAAQQAAEQKAQAAREEAREADARRKLEKQEEHRKRDYERELERLNSSCTHRIRRREVQEASCFLRTETLPALLWRPSLECEVTRSALETQRNRFEAWKIEQEAQLERDVEKLTTRFQGASQDDQQHGQVDEPKPEMPEKAIDSSPDDGEENGDEISNVGEGLEVGDQQ